MLNSLLYSGEQQLHRLPLGTVFLLLVLTWMVLTVQRTLSDS